MEIYGSQRPTLTVGGRVFTNLSTDTTTGLIMLLAYTTGTGYNSTFRSPNATSGYAVPAAKTLRVLAMRIFAPYTAQSSESSIGYADNDVGIATTTAFTNAVRMGGAYLAGANINLIGASYSEAALNFTIPTGKYPMFDSGAVASTKTCVHIFGYLE